MPLNGKGNNMNVKDVCEKLNNIELCDFKSWKFNSEKFVIIHGYSDDLVVATGAIRDEYSGYNGGKASISLNGFLQDFYDVEHEEDDCQQYFEDKNNSKAIKINWCKDGLKWSFETEINHGNFDIIEDSEVFCRAIVFDISELNHD